MEGGTCELLSLHSLHSAQHSHNVEAYLTKNLTKWTHIWYHTIGSGIPHAKHVFMFYILVIQ